MATSGGHRGWIVAPGIHGGWMARAKIPGKKGAYRSKRFPANEKKQAESWARTTAASFVVLGQEAVQRKAATADMVQRYLAALTAEGRSSGHLANLRQILGPIAGAVPNLGAEDAGDSMAGWLLARDVAPRTANREAAQVRAFCRWAVRQGALTQVPRGLLAVRLRKVPRMVKPQFTVTELRTLLADPTDAFYRFAALLIYTGGRAAEVRALWWDDVDFSAGIVFFRQRKAGTHKTGERIVPLQPELRAILEPLLPPKHEARKVPIAGRGRWNNTRDFQAFLKRRGVRVEGRTLHSFRHSYIGILTATGEAAGVVRLYVGHQSEAMTHHYAEAAAWYRQVVEGWPRGRVQLKVS
jgi:integrase